MFLNHRWNLVSELMLNSSLTLRLLTRRARKVARPRALFSSGRTYRKRLSTNTQRRASDGQGGTVPPIHSSSPTHSQTCGSVSLDGLSVLSSKKLLSGPHQLITPDSQNKTHLSLLTPWFPLSHTDTVPAKSFMHHFHSMAQCYGYQYWNQIDLGSDVRGRP